MDIKRSLKIYVASSWRNLEQPNIVKILRKNGYLVYDFRNPCEGNKGFHWNEIDPKWKSWTPKKYRKCLNHELAENGFKSDFNALKWADAIIGVQPFGRSASMEMGWAAGAGKTTILLLSNGEPELMVKMFNYICCNMVEVLNILEKRQKIQSKAI